MATLSYAQLFVSVQCVYVCMCVHVYVCMCAYNYVHVVYLLYVNVCTCLLMHDIVVLPRQQPYGIKVFSHKLPWVQKIAKQPEVRQYS